MSYPWSLRIDLTRYTGKSSFIGGGFKQDYVEKELSSCNEITAVSTDTPPLSSSPGPSTNKNVAKPQKIRGLLYPIYTGHKDGMTLTITTGRVSGFLPM